MPGRLSSHAGFRTLKSSWATSDSATWELWGIYWWRKAGQGRPNRDLCPGDPKDLCSGSWSVSRDASWNTGKLLSFSEYSSSQGLLSPWHCSTPPAPFRQPKGTGRFASKQTNAVITNPKALTSAPSLDPKARAAEPACPSLSVRSWAPLSNSELTSGDSRSPVSKCLCSPIWAGFPAGTSQIS